MRLSALLNGLTLLSSLLLLPPAIAAPVEQLEGTWGTIGTPIKLGDGLKWQFTLDSAEFTIAPVRVGEFLTSCSKTEKILRINFTVQNPSSDRTQMFNHTAFILTAVDANNVNHEDNNLWGDSQTGEPLSIQLKPAQKISGYALIVTDASGPVPKLIVEPQTGAVVRYDLKDKVAGFVAPLADPADSSGTSVLATIHMPDLSAPVDLRSLRMQLSGFSHTSEAIQNVKPKPGHQYLRAALSLSNLSKRAQRLNMNQFETFVQIGSRKYQPTSYFYYANSTDTMSEMMDAESMDDFWFYYEVPEEYAEATLHFAQAEDGHMFVFPIP